MPTRRFLSLLFIVVSAFALIVCMTFNGILQPDTRLLGVYLLGALTLAWTIAALFQRKYASTNALDAAVILWITAFSVSTITNQGDLDRISIGIWFVLLYMCVYYAVCGGLARGWWTRATVLDALLVVGAVALFFSGAQVYVGAGLPVSFLGNTNAFGLLVVIIIPLALERALRGKRLTRPVMTLYAAAAVILLVRSGSRGALLGGIAAIAAWIAVTAYSNRAAIVRMWRGWRAGTRRVLLIGGGGLLTIAAVVGGVWFARSFSVGGRTLDLRTWIYSTAIAVFAEQPIAGAGLFTFGGELMARNSTPYHEPHSHAHNLILHVAAELGLIGLIALALTGVIIARALWRTLRSPERSGERAAMLALGAALVGVGVHTLFDMPLMMPTLMLMTVIALAGVTAPSSEPRETVNRTMTMRRFVVPVVAVVLAISALVNAVVYRSSIAALIDAVSLVETGWRVGGWQLSVTEVGAAAEVDPVMYVQLGMVWALVQEHAGAAEAYARAVEAAPHDAILWINLAATRLAAGDKAGALTAGETAIALAPDMADSWGGILVHAANPAYVSPETFPLGDDPTGADWQYGANVAYGQYLHLVIPRVFVPQLNVPP